MHLSPATKSQYRKCDEHGLPRYIMYAHQNMLSRCTSPKHPKYKDYGGRGITVCDRWAMMPRWQGRLNLFEDMGPRPSAKHSLDRIDNDGPYSPDNCRWATSREQIANQRWAGLLHQIGTDKVIRWVSTWSEEDKRRLLLTLGVTP